MFSRNLTRICNRFAMPASVSSHLRIVTSAFGRFSSTNNERIVFLAGKALNSRTSSSALQFPKQLSSSTRDDETESSVDCEEELMEDFEQDIVDIDRETSQIRYKNLLYPMSEDVLIHRLNACDGPDELFQLFQQDSAQFTEQHLTQFTILLWSWFRRRSTNSTLKIDVSSPIFQLFLEQLLTVIPKMNYDEMTCCLLYLQKIGVDSSNKTMQELLCSTMNSINQANSEVPLSALSRLAVAVRDNKDIYPFLINKDIIPHLLNHLNKCTEAEEVRLIVICMQHLNLLVTKDMLNMLRSKVDELIENGSITRSNVRCIIKVINFLNFPHWSHENTPLIRSLLLLLESEIAKLSIKELETVFRVVQSQMEPASIIESLKTAATKVFERCPAIETLDYVIYFLEPYRRFEMATIIENMITNETLTSNQLPLVFRMLRSLKISKIGLCNKYWSFVLDEIRQNPQEREPHQLARHCHRYMHFNNNLGGTYHHSEFESVLCTLLIEDIEKGFSGILPNKFARCAPFVIAYGDNRARSEGIPSIIIDKMNSMANQFSVYDCLQLSRGLQIAFGMRFRNSIAWEVAPKLNQISSILDGCAERHLQGDLSLQDLNYIVRSFINRKAARKTNLFQTIMDRYGGSLDYLSSRLIRDITFNMSATNYVIPKVCESILKYAYDNRAYIMGDTIEKILTCLYNIGYAPQNMEALHWCGEIVKRDFKFMNSYAIVQACLALCFYKSLSEQLINRVFSIDFIQQVEDEIKNCYSKETYPERILNQVMQLNRAVCLDYPEAQVPWFQQNYIEAQMSKQPQMRSKFYADIKNMLTSVVKDETVVRYNHVTPYGYRIDFVLHVNRKNEFIAPPKDNKVLEKIYKIAILLQKLDSYCEDKLTAMKGSELLKSRHLEILGYKVVYINLNDWNSMYMNMPGAKVNYLKNLLQIQ